MTRTTEAIFSDGKLTPLDPLPLREQERVRITVESLSAAPASPHAAQRMIAGFDKMRLETGGKLPTREQLHERD